MNGDGAERDVNGGGRGMAERRVSMADLGAWLLKGNADRADLKRRFALDPRVERWCVQPGYRARLMRAGHPVVFWASGSRTRLPYGIWGIGRLSGPAVLDRENRQCWVPLDLRILPEEQWLRREELREDRVLAELEVLRQPQAGNPSFLTVAQFAALRDVGRSVPRGAPASRGEPGGRGEPGPPGESGSLRWRRFRP